MKAGLVLAAAFLSGLSLAGSARAQLNAAAIEIAPAPLASFAPATPAQLTSIQTLLGTEAGGSLLAQIPALGAVRDFAPGSQRDLRAAGPLARALARFEEAMAEPGEDISRARLGAIMEERRYPKTAMKRLAAEIARAYYESIPAVEAALKNQEQAAASAYLRGEMDERRFKKVVLEASPLALYGAQAAESIQRLEALQLAANSNATLERANQIAHALIWNRPLEPEVSVGESGSKIDFTRFSVTESGDNVWHGVARDAESRPAINIVTLRYAASSNQILASSNLDLGGLMGTLRRGDLPERPMSAGELKNLRDTLAKKSDSDSLSLLSAVRKVLGEPTPEGGTTALGSPLIPAGGAIDFRRFDLMESGPDAWSGIALDPESRPARHFARVRFDAASNTLRVRLNLDPERDILAEELQTLRRALITRLEKNPPRISRDPDQVLLAHVQRSLKPH